MERPTGRLSGQPKSGKDIDSFQNATATELIKAELANHNRCVFSLCVWSRFSWPDMSTSVFEAPRVIINFKMVQLVQTRAPWKFSSFSIIFQRHRCIRFCVDNNRNNNNDKKQQAAVPTTREPIVELRLNKISPT